MLSMIQITYPDGQPCIIDIAMACLTATLTSTLGSHGITILRETASFSFPTRGCPEVEQGKTSGCIVSRQENPLSRLRACLDQEEIYLE
jgi:hypothetical protein